MELSSALWLDGVCVATVAIWCAVSRRFSVYHPLVIYLAFHIIIMTGRAHAIYRGAEGLFPLGAAQAAKALFVADSALIAIATGVWVALVLRGGKGRVAPAIRVVRFDHLSRPLVVTAFVFVPFGLYSVVRHGFLERGTAGLTEVNNWANAGVLWPGVVLAISIFTHGYKFWNTMPLIILLVIYGTQGDQRFRAVTIGLLLLFTALSKRGIRWPKFKYALAAFLGAALFLPMDSLSSMIQSGRANLRDALELVAQVNLEGLQYRRYDMMIFDHLSAVIYLTDLTESLTMGRMYLALLTLPIPRAWWPEKPSLAVAIEYLSTPTFPLSEIGAVLTLPGDYYLNFGYIGMLIGCLATGYAVCIFYMAAERRSFAGTFGLFYLSFAAISVQVWRDGLVSAVVFMVVYFMPIVFFCVSAYVMRISDAQDAETSGEMSTESRR